MNKFLKNITQSSAGIKETRAKLTAQDAESAQLELIRELEQGQRDLERQLDTLTDIYPDSELSLQPTKTQFNQKEWARKVQNIKVQLANKKVEVKLAQETYDEYFKEESISE